MQIPDDLKSLFTAKIDEIDGQPVIQLPDQEIALDTLAVGDTYQVAILPGPEQQAESTTASQSQSQSQSNSRDGQQMPGSEGPPVTEGDQVAVEIESQGEQGDGVARVGAGYVLFVPGADVGDRVTVEVTNTTESFGFAEVVSPEPVTG